jgi:alkylation response protein AidB-like acyl-CoA dehydrogenase
VWVGMGLDSKLSLKAVNLKRETGKMMDEIVDRLEPYYESATFPDWVIEKLRALKINGLTIKGYGSPELNTVEMGSIIFEMAKRDAGLASFMLVHNAIGMAVVNSLGDEE